jgi:hypothetical protein
MIIATIIRLISKLLSGRNQGAGGEGAAVSGRSRRARRV